MTNCLYLTSKVCNRDQRGGSPSGTVPFCLFFFLFWHPALALLSCLILLHWKALRSPTIWLEILGEANDDARADEHSQKWARRLECVGASWFLNGHFQHDRLFISLGSQTQKGHWCPVYIPRHHIGFAGELNVQFSYFSHHGVKKIYLNLPAGCRE